MKIIIYGNGDFGRLIYHYFKKDTSYKVVAFCADGEYIKNNKFCELPLVDFKTVEKIYPPEEYGAFVAIGYSNMRARVAMYNKIKEKGYSLVNYISSKSLIDSSVTFGENNVVFPNTVIEPFVKIGNNNIIWSSVVISHDVTIKSHCFLASHSVIGGFSEVNDNCFIGFNATVLQNIKLAKETLVGANSLVLSNSEKYGKYIGVPAKLVSFHKEEGIIVK